MNFEHFITTYWPFITSIGGLGFAGVVGWVNLKRDVKDVDIRIDEIKIDVNKHDVKLEALNPVMLEIQKELATLNTSMDFVKVQIASLTDRREPRLKDYME